VCFGLGLMEPISMTIYSVVNFKQQIGEEQGEHTSLITHAETCSRSI